MNQQMNQEADTGATVESGPFGESAAETIEHLNDEHDDTITFLGRVLCGEPDVQSARLTAVDHDGIGLALVTSTRQTLAGRVAFGIRAETADDAQREFFELLALARQRSSDSELTSLERELSGVTTIPTHVTSVLSVTDITPRLRQITVQGGLERFVPIAADQFVYVLAPPHGSHQLTIDASFSWEQYEQMPKQQRPVGAYYTVRRWHPDTKSLDLWVVLHGHDGDGERWAATAQPGDPVALWGPREAYERPASCDAVLLVGDETALPAIAAILEQLDPADPATVIVALEQGARPIELVSPATVDVRWLTVTGDDRSNPLLAAVVELDTITPTTYAWGGAESHDVTAIRRHLRDVVGLARDQVSMTGYWRRSDDSHNGDAS